MAKQTVFGLDKILEILPHRPPFLFVDRVIRFTPEKMIVAERTILEDEPWFEGHFPKKAIMPGALVLDALAQTSGLLLGFSKQVSENNEDENKIFYLAASNIKFLSPAFPGETLELIAETAEKFGALRSYRVEAITERKIVAKGTLTLAAKEGKP
ncbi:MAG: 3-hydroxyacyl-ACP dehydratase FabZ [Proteobacteria bacterium]|nr:3-hydroxyacyl-ACP dehydratase FabZ [Pseudomonadota bacterium]